MADEPLRVPVAPRIRRWRLHWQRIGALALNGVLWWALIRAIGEIMR